MSHYIERHCHIHGMFLMDVDNSADCDECPSDEDRRKFADNRGVTICMDGDKWCATASGFKNLQISPSGFGSTPDIALNVLMNEIKD